jgi:hypothetical protein
MTALSAGPVATITCPSWCTISPSEHLTQLRWEGRTVHWSERRHGDGWQIRTGVVVDASGDRTDATPEVHVNTSESLTPAAAEALALTLLGALEQTRD